MFATSLSFYGRNQSLNYVGKQILKFKSVKNKDVHISMYMYIWKRNKSIITIVRYVEN